MAWTLERARLATQLPLTLAILVLVPTNAGKLVALLVLWAVTFGRMSRPDLVMAVAVSALFTVMNAAALRQGIFSFRNHDLLGMPMWELFMWGFYATHTLRLLGGPVPRRPSRGAWLVAIPFAAAFASIPDPTILLMVTATLLVAALIQFHEPFDFAYAGYFTVMGAAVEYTGVSAGLWSYPEGTPSGGVPLWFAPMWFGVGLFLRRMVLPFVYGPEEQGST